MCAECHSTGVRKNYDAANDRFATTLAEISVGCEACHGQGSRHVAWARDAAELVAVRQERRSDARDCSSGSTSATMSPGRSIRRPATRARNVAPATLRKEVETCGLCHARRGEFSEDWVPGRCAVRHARGLAARPRALSCRRADAATRSTTTARSSRARCSRPASPAAIATSRTAPSCARRATASACNATPPTNTPTPRITTMTAATRRSTCASCHMPARTYMVVDQRHDHSFRVPRPDLSVKLGTPNACNDCHARQAGGHGRRRRSKALARAGPQGLPELRRGVPRRVDATSRMRRRCWPSWRRIQNAPAIARASALARARRPRSRPSNIDLARSGFARSRSDGADRRARHARKRAGVAASGRSSRRCCRIPVRGVRIRAASLLAAVPAASQPPADRERFERAAAEFVAAQRLNADRPEARATLGTLLRAARPVPANAEAEYKAALRLEPAICAGGDQSRRSLSADRAGRRGT